MFTYYSDHSYLNASAFLKAGGYWGGDWGNSTSGMFEVHWFSNSESASFVGSETTYYSDTSQFYASRFPMIGGLWFDGSYAGMFHLYVNNPTSVANSVVCSSPLIPSF